MRRILYFLAILIILAAPLLAEPQTYTYSGNSTAPAFTNVVGQLWIINVQAVGTFTGTNTCSITVNNGNGAVEIYNQTSPTTSFLYQDGTAAQEWLANGVLTITMSSDGASTNKVVVRAVNQR